MVFSAGGDAICVKKLRGFDIVLVSERYRRQERYRFCLDCGLEQFREVTYEDIQNTYNTRIPQKDTDSIVDNELRFFAWKCSHEWGYVLVPVYRRLECLYMGDGQFFPFEHEDG